MGGQILEYEAKTILKEGEEKGREKGSKEVKSMCDVAERLVQRGRQEGRQEAINNLLENTGYTFEKVLELLGIPSEERHLYHQ